MIQGGLAPWTVLTQGPAPSSSILPSSSPRDSALVSFLTPTQTLRKQFLHSLCQGGAQGPIVSIPSTADRFLLWWFFGG